MEAKSPAVVIEPQKGVKARSPGVTRSEPLKPSRAERRVKPVTPSSRTHFPCRLTASASGPRVHRAPGVPHALSFGGWECSMPRALMRREIAEVWLGVSERHGLFEILRARTTANSSAAVIPARTAVIPAKAGNQYAHNSRLLETQPQLSSSKAAAPVRLRSLRVQPPPARVRASPARSSRSRRAAFRSWTSPPCGSHQPGG